MDLKQIQEWAKSEEGRKAIKKAFKTANEATKCENIDHFDSLLCFSGADIYWKCLRCGRVWKQEGGNLPMTI